MYDDAPGWYSRGYLPHFDDGERAQTVTYRLADALPADVVARIRERFALSVDHQREEMEKYLDVGYGSCLLLDGENAEIVVQGWQHFDSVRYRLHSWCVMPTHVHVLIAPMGGHSLAGIVQAQKSYTAKAILRRLPGSAGLRPAFAKSAGGSLALPVERHLWQPDYYDRFIRNQRHFDATVDYIHQNPVKAGLVACAEVWPWSSARDWERLRRI